jgi:hypothetical protein
MWNFTLHIRLLANFTKHGGYFLLYLEKTSFAFESEENIHLAQVLAASQAVC